MRGCLWSLGQGLGVLILFTAWAWSAGCAPEAGHHRSEPQDEGAQSALPPALRNTLRGREVGDLLPTNDATFQLQVSKPPTRFIVRMYAPRAAVAPAVQAYFRNLGVEDLGIIQLFWCESAKRGPQDIWSCAP
jgi:hypothetical protein